MRLKLDENIPADASGVAEELGHDVETVLEEALGGEADPEVLRAASDEGRFLVTLDRGFGDIRQYPPGSHAGIVVLRVGTQDSASVADTLSVFLTNDALGDLTGCIVVVRGHLVRVRRPE